MSNTKKYKLHYKKISFIFLYFFILTSCNRYIFLNPENYLKAHSISISGITNLINNDYNFLAQNTRGIYPIQLIVTNPSAGTLGAIKYLVEEKNIPLTQISSNADSILNAAAQNNGPYSIVLMDYLITLFREKKYLGQYKDLDQFLLKTNNPLVDATANIGPNALRMVHLLLNNNISRNRLGRKKQTPIMEAAANPSKLGVPIVAFLLKNKVALNNVDYEGKSLAHYIASNTGPYSLDLLRLFYKRFSIKLDQKDLQGRYPIEIAVANEGESNFSLIKYFFPKSLFANLVKTPLFMEKIFFIAVQNMSSSAINIVKYFLSYEPIINYIDQQGYSALAFANRNHGLHTLKIVQLLVKNGANIYNVAKDYATMLNIASRNRGPYGLSLVKYFENLGLSVYHIDPLGKTLLHYASTNEGAYAGDIVNYLIDKGINPFLKDKFNSTALMLGAKNRGSQALQIVSDIVYRKYQGVLEQRDNTSPILEAVKNRGKDSYKIVRFLMQKGFIIDITQVDGQNAMILAVRNEGPNTLKIVSYLLNKGFNLNHQDKYGNTTVHYSFLNRIYQFPLLKILLDNGADPTIKNSDGDNIFTLLKTLSPFYQKLMIDLLKEYHFELEIN